MKKSSIVDTIAYSKETPGGAILTDRPARKWLSLGIVLWVFSITICSYANNVDSIPEELDFFNMPLEELAKVPYRIYSASRTAQDIGDLAVPVSVVTREDIHYSGLTNIPDLLQYVLGISIRRYDRNTVAVGVRGIQTDFADRTLILLNGRNLLNPAFGGMDWDKLPICMEDIERIEIVRGPGGAVWGANALAGVINIITLKPDGRKDALASTTLDEYGDSYSHIRVQDSWQRFNWHMSMGYEDRKDSDQMGAGDFTTVLPSSFWGATGYSTYQARDFARNLRMNLEGMLQSSDATQWHVGCGYVNIERGDHPVTGVFFKDDVTASTTRPFARVNHEFEDGRSAHLQWYGNYDISHAQMYMTRWRIYENDIESQYNQQLGDHHVSLGTNVRYVSINTQSVDPQEIYIHDDHEDWFGFFLVDRLNLTERLSLETQGRLDWYSESDRDWSARVAALYALDSKHDHMLRFSWARAFRANPAVVRSTETHRIDMTTLGMPNTYYINNVVPSDLKNEHTWSLEAGYTGHVSPQTTLNLNGSYQRFEEFMGSYSIQTTPTIIGTVDNDEGMDLYAADFELRHQIQNGQISLWYSFQDLQEDQNAQAERSLYPTRHNVGMTTRWQIHPRWTANANYRYHDAMAIQNDNNNSLGDIDLYHRLDLTLTHSFAQDRGEWMVGVTDLLNQTLDAKIGETNFAGHSLVGQTFFTRIQFRF